MKTARRASSACRSVSCYSLQHNFTYKAAGSLTPSAEQ